MFQSNNLLLNFFKYKRKLHLNITRITNIVQYSTTPANNNKGKHLKILFFGTDNFSLPSLKKLHKNIERAENDKSLGVVTSFKSPVNCVRNYAEQHQLPLFRWPVTAETCRHYDLGVVVSFGHLIPEIIIQAFPLGMINVHASLLPRWRGAAPIIYSIMHGDKVTGVSVMKIEPKHFDVGDILAQREVTIRENMFMPELHEKLANEGAALLSEVVNGYPASFENAKKQNNTEASLAPKITPAITEVQWLQMNAQQIFNRFRALYSFKYLSTKLQHKNLQFIEVKLPSPETICDKPAALPTRVGGFVYRREHKCLLVCCANASYLEVHKLRIEGKKAMSASEFNNGFLKKLKVDEYVFNSNKTC